MSNLEKSNHYNKDRIDLLAGTIKRACDEVKVDLVAEEQTWLRGVIDAALSSESAEGDSLEDPRNRSITLAFGKAMRQENQRLKARLLAELGKESLLKSGGIGVQMERTAPALQRFFRDIASTAFTHAAELDPLLEAQSLLLEEPLGTEGLVTDPEEIRQGFEALKKREWLLRNPWLLRVASKVPDLSRVISVCRADLLRNRTADLFLIGTDPIEN